MPYHSAIPSEHSRDAREAAKRTQPEDSAWSEYAGGIAANLRRLRQEAGLSQDGVDYPSESRALHLPQVGEGRVEAWNAGEPDDPHAACDVAGARRLPHGVATPWSALEMQERKTAHGLSA